MNYCILDANLFQHVGVTEHSWGQFWKNAERKENVNSSLKSMYNFLKSLKKTFHFMAFLWSAIVCDLKPGFALQKKIKWILVK